MNKTLMGNPTSTDLDFTTPPSNPLLMLQQWLETAERLGVSEPKGMVLSTVDRVGHPSSRVVALTECDETGVIFGTNQGSAKGKDLEINPFAAGNLWWRETIQQITFCGQIKRFSNAKSDELFRARAREAQAVSAISQQSAPLTNEIELREKMFKLINTPGKIERPDKWHAYHFAIESIEFWQGNKDRFHKRLRYDLVNGLWHHQPLQP